MHRQIGEQVRPFRLRALHDRRIRKPVVHLINQHHGPRWNPILFRAIDHIRTVDLLERRLTLRSRSTWSAKRILRSESVQERSEHLLSQRMQQPRRPFPRPAAKEPPDDRPFQREVRIDRSPLILTDAQNLAAAPERFPSTRSPEHDLHPSGRNFHPSIVGTKPMIQRTNRIPPHTP